MIKRAIVCLLAMVLVFTSMSAAGSASKGYNQKVDFYLTILHNNDGESQVINAGADLSDFGGAARFKKDRFSAPTRSSRSMPTGKRCRW